MEGKKMNESTLDMLTQHVDSAFETIEEFARQIESGEYGNKWQIDTGEEYVDVIAESAVDAAENYDGNVEYAEHIDDDEPTIWDENGNSTPISKWPLDIVVKIGRPLAVLITAGGPHIKIEQDLGNGSAQLVGYSGGEKVYRHGKVCQTVLDYLTDDLFDKAPEEYK